MAVAMADWRKVTTSSYPFLKHPISVLHVKHIGHLACSTLDAVDSRPPFFVEDHPSQPRQSAQIFNVSCHNPIVFNVNVHNFILL